MLATEIALQWLRPWWLLAFLPMAWLMWRAWQIKAKQGAWHKIIEPKFQNLLLGSQQSQSFTLAHKAGLMSLAIIWSLLILILAGPSFKAVEIPAQKSQQGTVIVLDLSLSMLADDLAPSRLSRVKFKLTDLIKANPQESIGMVAYAGTAHSIIPISEDNQTLLGLLPSLNPLIMPEYGSNPILGMEKAKTLFEGAHVTDGHILWITDDIESTQIEAIQSFFKANDYSLSILTVGTTQGGLIQIPNYGVLKDDQERVVLPSVPVERFVYLSQKLNAPLQALKIEDNDFSKLLDRQSSLSTSEQKQQPDAKEILHPLDQGVALLILLVPLIAFIYRRGWLFSWLLIGFLPAGIFVASLGYAPNSYAVSSTSQWEELANTMQTHDQQAYNAWNKENYAAAEALFENPQWQASSLYRLGRYAEAAKLFAQDKSSSGLYNLGNALAKSGDLEGAKKAYEKALRLNSDMSDAQQNLAIVNQLLEQQKAQKPPENSIGDGQDSGAQTSQQDAKNNSAENSDNQASENNQNNAQEGSQSDSQNNANSSDAASQAANGSDHRSNAPNAQKTNLNQALNDDLNKSIEDKLSAAKDPAASQDSTQQAPESTDTKQQNLDAEPQTQNNPEDANGQMVGQGSEQQNGEKGMGKLQQSLVGDADSDTKHGDAESPKDSAHQDSQGNQANRLAGKLDPEPATQTSGSNAEQEQQMATDNWIQQIPDAPGVFLQRKFEYQYNQFKAQKNAENGDHSENGTKTW